MTRRASTCPRRVAPTAALALLATLTAAPGWALRANQGTTTWPEAPDRDEQVGIDLTVTPATRTPYAGEVFDVEALVTAAGKSGGQVVGSPQWQGSTSSATANENWSTAERITVNGTPAIRFRSRAAATAAGATVLPEVTQELRVRGDGPRLADVFKDRFFSGGFGSDVFDDFFAETTTRTITVASAPTALDVRPLPEPAPPGFSGAVGHFTLDAQLTPAAARAGDPLTWTLTLRGTGNWPAGITLPARTVPAGTRTLKPKTRTEFDDAQRFAGSVSEDLVIIPGDAGSLHLDPVRFVYFDPTTSKYVTLQADVPAVDLQPGAAPATAQMAPASAPAAAGQSLAPDAPATRLPQVPLEGTASGLAPVTPRILLTAAAIPLVLLAAFALWLGSVRARAHDPLRSRRLAAARLTAIVGAVRGAATPEARTRELLDWQRTAARALALPTQAPTSATLRTLPLPVPAAVGDEWATLWLQSEHALHAPGGTLPADWCDRAAHTAQETGVPRFNVLRGLMPQHVFATAIPAMALVVILGAGPAAAGPLADYQAGNFTAAGETWQRRAAAAPTDWIARYNLGVTEAQLGNAGRALADTTAAFLLKPRDASVRWNLGAFADKVAAADARLVALAHGTGAAALARQLSPFAWQLTLLSGVMLLAGAAAAGLYRKHRGVPRRPGQLAAAMLPGLVLFAAAAVALHVYGPLADPDAAITVAPTALRSVPTAVAQVDKPIGAGGIVRIDRRFLDWVRVSRDDGEQGWVRNADLVPLFSAPPPVTVEVAPVTGAGSPAETS